MLKIVADDKIPFLQGVFEKFGVEVAYISGSKISRKDLLDADALITRTRTLCNEELLHDTPVKIIVTATIGTDHIDIDYLKNENIGENLAFSFQAQRVANAYYPGLARKIYLKGYRYNMHYKGKSLLVELGAQTNTVEEMRHAMEVLARILSDVLY